jgi:hypothetical protein
VRRKIGTNSDTNARQSACHLVGIVYGFAIMMGSDEARRFEAEAHEGGNASGKILWS